MKVKIFIALLSFWCSIKANAQQIGNYVTNGSFEHFLSPPVDCNPVGWRDLDSNKNVVFSNSCVGNMPNFGFSYQYPRTGSGQAFSTYFFFDVNLPYSRSYVKNNLKHKLKKDAVYCVKFYVNNGNNSTHGIDAFEAYFGDSLTIDTIKYGHLPLIYLSPQIRNPKGNIISDTLNWTVISGTFIAKGTEEYLVIGNFETNANTDTLLCNPTGLPTIWCEATLDDVSCIPVDLPAYAGPDKPFFAGDSVYIGRELDFAVDPYCFWYKLPNMTTAIDTASGIWVKPTSTSTYVVRQELECNTVKYDTVVVYKDALGTIELGILNDELTVRPNPAADAVLLSLPNTQLSHYINRVEILDTHGQLVKELLISEKDAELTITVQDLDCGMYFLRLSDAEHENVMIKKIAVQH